MNQPTSDHDWLTAAEGTFGDPLAANSTQDAALIGIGHQLRRLANASEHTNQLLTELVQLLHDDADTVQIPKVPGYPNAYEVPTYTRDRFGHVTPFDPDQPNSHWTADDFERYNAQLAAHEGDAFERIDQSTMTAGVQSTNSATRGTNPDGR